MSRCRQMRALLHLYVDNELAPPEVLELEAHLVDCPTCDSEYQKVRAVVDTVRGASPLYEAPESSRRRAEQLVARSERPRRGRYRAAAAVAAVAGLAAVTLLTLRRSSSGEFAAYAADTHLRFARGAMPLDIASSEPAVVSAWLKTRLPFHLELPDYPAGPGERKRYELVGARLLQYANEDVGYLAYQMDGKPISLLMAATAEAAPSGGELFRSGALTFHFASRKGLKLISWTDRGIHYCLVSELEAGAAESCVVCHGAAAERRKFEGLKPKGM